MLTNKLFICGFSVSRFYALSESLWQVTQIITVANEFAGVGFHDFQFSSRSRNCIQSEKPV